MKIISQNKRAFFDYEILETFEAGLVLHGFEVKAVKTGHINLAGSFVVIRNNEAYLLNANIPAYQPANTPPDYDPSRTRKLLLKKSEIKYLTGKINQKGLTLLPLRVYTKKNKVKLGFGLARGKRQTDKREIIRKRETEREIERRMKDF